jgi:hypothetical protein
MRASLANFISSCNIEAKEPGGVNMPDQARQKSGVLPPNVPAAAEVPESPAAPERHPTASDRSWWKKYRTAIVLAAIGLALFLVTVGLYPSTTQLPVPLSSTLALEAPTLPVASITYEVRQISSSVAEIEVTILLPINVRFPPANTPVVGLVVSPPIGTSFTRCPPPACKSEPKGISSWKRLLGFTPLKTLNGTSGIAYADFYVRADHFGGTYNDVNASVVAPVVMYYGKGTPTLLTQYNIPDAAKYDWSVFPLEFASASFATWSEPITNGQIPARVADGTDFANQGKDNYHTFLAGVILGLAGGALLTALQETLDANKK